MPERTPEELIEAYQGVRRRVRAAVESAPPERLAQACPCTPAWTVHDTLAHLVGVPNDVREGRVEGVATDAWTQAQVDARRATPESEMLDAWEADSVAIEPMFEAVGFSVFGQMLFDAATHEYDIDHALALPADRASLALDCAFDWATGVGGQFRGQALRLRTEQGDVAFGPGDPVATVELSRFEFLRAAVGRRSRAQVRQYPTDAPIEPEAILLSTEMFRLAAVDIVE